jgi:WD40 repeat protein
VHGVYAIAAGTLSDGTPVVVSGGSDGTVRVWRLADGTPVGEPLRLHGDDAVSEVAMGRLADGSPVVVSGGVFREKVCVWRLPDGAPVGEPVYGAVGGTGAIAAGTLVDGALAAVIVSGGKTAGSSTTVQVWRLPDGTPVSEPLPGHDGKVHTVAAGGLSDGTPVAVTGGSDGAVRVWRLADGTLVRKLLPAHDGEVNAVTVGALPDGSLVVVSGGDDGTVRVWRLADGALLVPPLNMSRSVVGVAVHRDVIVSAAGGCIAAIQPALPAGTTT